MKSIKRLVFTDWTIFIATLLMGLGTIAIVTPTDVLPDFNKVLVVLSVIFFTVTSFMITINRHIKSKMFPKHQNERTTGN